MRKITPVLLIVVVGLFMAGCRSQSSTTSNNPPGNSTPVGMTITDTPPQGVTVLFFQLSITGASLTDSTTHTTVSLLSSTNPIPVNVTQLQSELFFLGNANVPSGTYDTLTVTFSNAQLTIYNGSDTNISSTCAVGTVCQITPATSGMTVTFTSGTPPFPITLTASSPVAFKLDIHLDTVIQSDLSLNLSAPNGVTISLISPPSRFGKLRGTIQSVGTNQFTLQTWEGRTFTIDVNGSTNYENFPSSATTGCASAPDTFVCLATGQYVKVTVTLQSDGSLLATDVDYLAPSAQSVEGTIIGLTTTTSGTIMDLILQWEPPNSMSNMLPLGHFAQVTVPSTATYAINWNGFTFTAPSGVTLSFASASDLQVGQQVMVAVQGTVSTSGAAVSTAFGHPGLTFTASEITLEASQITGTVASVTPTSYSFTLATMPVFFVPPSSTPGSPPPWAPVIITVQTSTNGATTLTNFPSNGLAGLEVNNVVSVDGWVFSTPTATPAITVAADQVILRTGVTPLF